MEKKYDEVSSNALVSAIRNEKDNMIDSVSKIDYEITDYPFYNKLISEENNGGTYLLKKCGNTIKNNIDKISTNIENALNTFSKIDGEEQ